MPSIRPDADRPGVPDPRERGFSIAMAALGGGDRESGDRAARARALAEGLLELQAAVTSETLA